jgi:hypothetical protein
MSSKANKRVSVRCPWCGKQPVPLKRGHVQSHLTPGGLKCIAIGMDVRHCKTK